MDEWNKKHKFYFRLKELNRSPNQSYETFRRGIENENPEICANVIIGLIKVASFLLNRQLKQFELAFIQEGGLRKRMTRARLNERNKQ